MAACYRRGDCRQRGPGGLGLIDLSKSIYTGAKVAWLSAIVGGFLFGFGMTLGSGCGSKTLIRVGAGNLKSVVVLVFLGIAAYMTLRGLFAVWRAAVLDRADRLRRLGCATSDLPTLIAAAGGAWPTRVGALRGGGGARRLRVRGPRFPHDPRLIVGGIVIGLVIVGGWYVTGHIGYLAEDPNTLEEEFVATNSGRIESFSFVAGGVSLELLMLWSDKSRIITFGIAGVLGMIAGSAAYALARSFAGKALARRRLGNIWSAAY